jgi:hypothetical protein
MGLDTFASRSRTRISLTDEDKRAFADAGIQLCGGLQSGVSDASSFRGKVYIDIVDRVAGANLLDDWIPPEAMGAIAAAFERCGPAAVAEASQDDRYPISTAEVDALRRFFRLCADRGLGLIGWS